MVIWEVSVPPDPVAIARALRAASSQRASSRDLGTGLVVLLADARGAMRSEDARFSFVAVDPVATSFALVPEHAAHPAPGWGGFPAAPRWVGAVPYEALRGIERRGWTREPDARPPALLAHPTWNRYAAVVRVDHVTGAVAIEADDCPSAARLRGAIVDTGFVPPAAFELSATPPDEPDEAHVERVRRVLELIAAGDVYQVNVARRIPLLLRGCPLSLFASLVRAAPAPYGLYAELADAVVCASSPELALAVDGDGLRTAPIKGTRPRGADAWADTALAEELDRHPKERAELTMAIDLHRNDLGRVSVAGSVRVLGAPRVVAGVVWSRVAEVVARRAPGTSLEDVVRAMLPCGSVTGAPKVRAMEIIARLEPSRRGLYTGAFGYLGGDGRLVLAMAIRTVVAAASADGDERAASYHSGGGIVADSDPELELEETRWKAAQLAALGHEVAETWPDRGAGATAGGHS